MQIAATGQTCAVEEDINGDMESAYQRNRIVMGKKEEVLMKQETKEDEQLKQYKNMHRVERMQAFLSNCQVTAQRKPRRVFIMKRNNLLTSRNQDENDITSMQAEQSTRMTHKGHTPSRALREAETSYNISTVICDSTTKLPASRNSAALVHSANVNSIKCTRRPSTNVQSQLGNKDQNLSTANAISFNLPLKKHQQNTSRNYPAKPIQQMKRSELVGLVKAKQIPLVEDG